MKVVGLITEYNPFHNGHQYHIQKALEITRADRVIVVMSGNFVQRGAPAIMPKELRTQAALQNGASLVLELPLPYATGTAEQFAQGAVSILHKLGCVDAICFGSECGDIDKLLEVATVLVSESTEFQETLQNFLRNGDSFPAARQKTIDVLYPGKEYGALLAQPNNILGIEYLKALIHIKSQMKPFTIKRDSSKYHDITLNEHSSSASAIRHALQTFDYSILKTQVPQNTYKLLENTFNKRYPIFLNDFSLLLKFKLLNETKTTIIDYADVSEELANRIYKQLNQFSSFEQFCELLKTKEITYSRISRALLHILLGVRKSDASELTTVRMLGFQKDHADLLTKIKDRSSISLISKLSSEIPVPNLDIQSANLYESVIADKFNTPFINEYEHPIIRI